MVFKVHVLKIVLMLELGLSSGILISKDIYFKTSEIQ